jgi:hypothetical protein
MFAKSEAYKGCRKQLLSLYFYPQNFPLYFVDQCIISFK